jgi:hypothetical protein
VWSMSDWGKYARSPGAIDMKDERTKEGERQPRHRGIDFGLRGAGAAGKREMCCGRERERDSSGLGKEGSGWLRRAAS